MASRYSQSLMLKLSITMNNHQSSVYIVQYKIYNLRMVLELVNLLNLTLFCVILFMLEYTYFFLFCYLFSILSSLLWHFESFFYQAILNNIPVTIVKFFYSVLGEYAFGSVINKCWER